jgi:glutamine synthetase
LIDRAKQKLLKELVNLRSINDWIKKATAYRQQIFTTMTEIRTYCDELERLTPKDLWPFPTYADILFS